MDNLLLYGDIFFGFALGLLIFYPTEFRNSLFFRINGNIGIVLSFATWILVGLVCFHIYKVIL